MKSHALVPVILLTIVLIGVLNAQYSQKWGTTLNVDSIGYFVGSENTDADNDNEMVFVVHLNANQNTIIVVDGLTGSVEWTLFPYWYNILYSPNDLQNPNNPKLVDVDNDGRYEILFAGASSVAAQLHWYLYGYNAGAIDETPSPTTIYQDIQLGQNSPNPATLYTNIKYSLGQKGKVVMKIYNSAGKLIRTLLEGEKEAGSYTVNWDGRNDAGERIGNGSYFYQLEIDGKTQVKKMVLVK
jgi:FlgD Ig-like domain